MLKRTLFIMLTVFCFGIAPVAGAKNTQKDVKKKNPRQQIVSQLSQELEDLNEKVLAAYQLQKDVLNSKNLVVALNTANVHEKPKLKSKIVFKAHKGDTFGIVSQLGDFYQIKFNQGEIEKTGWIAVSDTKNRGLFKKMYESIIQSMIRLQARYQDSPYIYISGFTINVNIPPSVSINIDFRQQDSQSGGEGAFRVEISFYFPRGVQPPIANVAAVSSRANDNFYHFFKGWCLLKRPHFLWRLF